MESICRRIEAVVADRLAHPVQGSYVCALTGRGEDAVLRKIAEEATELLLAAKSEGDERLVQEGADLLFHLLVLLGMRGIPVDNIFAELESRFGIPGGRPK